MPRYCYHCSECDESYELVHPMNSKPTNCVLCDSIDSLTKIPTLFSIDVGSSSDSSTAKQRVDEFIHTAKQELKHHRDELSRKEYEG